MRRALGWGGLRLSHWIAPVLAVYSISVVIRSPGSTRTTGPHDAREALPPLLLLPSFAGARCQ